VGDFGVDTAVEAVGGRYRAQLSRDWEIWGPNGGYVAAIALRAAGAASRLRRPASFSCHFLSVAEFAHIDLDVATLRATKRAESLRVSMTQGGRPILEAIVWVVDDGLQALTHDLARMPSVPGPGELKSIEELVSGEERKTTFAFWQNLEAKPIEWTPWNERKPSAPVWREWYRFRPRATFDDPFADAARYLLLIDTLIWPAASRPYVPDSGHVAPSLDVSATFHRAAPDSEWLLCDASAPVAAHGLIGGRAAIWSAEGQLLASGGGQLFCRPRPSA
jgi:acyl-CoA thioesterase-2